MKIRIYKLFSEKHEENVIFLGYPITQRLGMPDFSEIYKLVYDGMVDYTNVEEVVNNFKDICFLPSDVIEVCGGANNERMFYYCDTCALFGNKLMTTPVRVERISYNE